MATQSTAGQYPYLAYDGLSFDGSNDSLSIPAHTDLNWGTGEFTLEFWSYEASATGHYLSFSESTLGYSGILITSARLVYIAISGNTWGVNGLTLGALEANTWLHNAVVRDSGGVVRTYKNGIQQGSISYSSAMIYDPTYTFSIGKYVFGPSYYGGKMTDVRLYHKCLYPGGVPFIPPPRSRPELPLSPPHPMSISFASALNTFDSGD